MAHPIANVARVARFTLALGLCVASLVTASGVQGAPDSTDRFSSHPHPRAQTGRPQSPSAKRAHAHVAGNGPSGQGGLAGLSPGTIDVIAGSYGNFSFGGDGQSATAAFLNAPYGVTVDGNGNVYIADSQNSLIRMVYAGGPVPGVLEAALNFGGAGVQAVPRSIYTIAGSAGEAAVLLQITCSPVNNGFGPPCGDGGPAVDNPLVMYPPYPPQLGNPQDVKVDASGNVFIADSSDQTVRVVYGGGLPVPPVLVNAGINSPTKGYIYTVAGQELVPSPASNGNPGPANFNGDGMAATSATLQNPASIFVDPAGNLYIADALNESVRVVYEADPAPPILAAEGIAVTSADLGKIYTVAGSYTAGLTAPNQCLAGPCGEGGAATIAGGTSGEGQFYGPTSVYVDSSGNLYVADGSATVRVVYVAGSVPGLSNAAHSTLTRGHIYTVAGNIADFAASASGPNNANVCLSGPCGDGGAAVKALLNMPTVVAGDASGNVYVVDTTENTLREIYSSGNVSGVTDPVAGNIYTIAGAMNLFSYDVANPVFPNPSACVPGAAAPFCGDGGPAHSAQFNGPWGVALDSTGSLYISDLADGVIREIAPVAMQTITFAALPDVSYGVKPISLTATVNSPLPVQYSVSGPAKIVGSVLSITGAGTVTVTASQPGNYGYAAATPVVRSFQVNPAVLTVTATLSVPYLTPAATVAAELPGAFLIEGLVSGDTASSVTSGAPALSLATPYSPSIQAGSRIAIDVAPGNLQVTSQNYAALTAASFVNGELTVVGNVAQSITFSPQAVFYGANPLSGLGATASSGLPITYQVVSGPGILQGANLVINQVGGVVTVEASQGGDKNYAPAAPVTLTLAAAKPAVLTVAAVNASVNVGQPLPALAYTITGFQFSDTQTNATTGVPALSTAATPQSPPGQYPITIAQGSLALVGSSSDYVFSFVNGTLTVTPGTPQTITFPAPQNEKYGDLPIVLQAVSTSGLPVTYALVSGPVTLTGSSLKINAAGTVVVTASQPGDAVYAAARPVTITFTIAPAVLTITAPDKEIPYGILGVNQPLPNGFLITSLMPIYSGFVNNDSLSQFTGSPVISTTATQGSPGGKYPILISQGNFAATNNSYVFQFVDGVLTIDPAPSQYFTVTAIPASLTLLPGQVQQTTLFVQPVNGYKDTIDPKTGKGGVTLSCGQLPAGITCTLEPSTYSIDGSGTFVGANTFQAAQGVLTISAGAQTVGSSRQSRWPNQGPNAGSTQIQKAAVLIPGALAAIFLMLHRRRIGWRARAGNCVMALSFLMAAISIGACGYSNHQNTSSFAKPGTSIISLNAAGSSDASTGGVKASIPLTITVQ